jgi:adenylate kinase family enzyme
MICGPICSGKTTISDLMLKNEKRLYRPSFDKLKSQLSDFEAEQDRSLIMELLFSLSRELVKNDLNLIIEGSASILYKMREFYSELAKSNGYKYLEINIEASKEELLRRLAIRVADGKSQSVSTEEQFMVRYNKYLEKRDSQCPIFSSEELSPEEIYKSVLKILNR